jgi:hypothetical protein
MKARALEHLNGLAVLKERLDGTVPTLPSRYIQENDAKLELGGVVMVRIPEIVTADSGRS